MRRERYFVPAMLHRFCPVFTIRTCAATKLKLFEARGYVRAKQSSAYRISENL